MVEVAVFAAQSPHFFQVGCVGEGGGGGLPARLEGEAAKWDWELHPRLLLKHAEESGLTPHEPDKQAQKRVQHVSLVTVALQHAHRWSPQRWAGCWHTCRVGGMETTCQSRARSKYCA